MTRDCSLWHDQSVPETVDGIDLRFHLLSVKLPAQPRNDNAYARRFDFLIIWPRVANQLLPVHRRIILAKETFEKEVLSPCQSQPAHRLRPVLVGLERFITPKTDWICSRRTIWTV